MNDPAATELGGRVAVVTGGAAGIGGAISRALAAAGAPVVLADLDGEGAERVERELVAAGGVARAVVGDVREPAAAEQVARAARDLDPAGARILVNNVGDYRPSGAFERSEESDWDALDAVNLRHVLRFTRALLPAMLERGAGAIVNVSTVEAFRGIPQAAVYSAYKAALVAFTRSLAVEVAGRGVRVNAIAPDVTCTPQTPYDRWIAPEEEALVPSWVPVGRVGQPEDAARVVLFLVSDASAFVTGQTLAVDGGTLAAAGWYKRQGEQRWTNRPRRP